MKLWILLCFLAFANAKPLNITRLKDVECAGYSACPQTYSDKINVHLIVHSHDDVGWVFTVDEYFYTKVNSIISSAVGSLLQNPERRYIQVETAYFQKWWDIQYDAVKEMVIDLVNEGRLELVNGAWSMNDEAAAHYHSTIDQFTLGLRFLEDNLGKCGRPRSGWQIDPFGHSREQASIFSQLGFESEFFARLDYRDRDKRRKEGTMDMLWTGSNNLGNNSNILTSAFYDFYTPPSGFDFDIRCCGGTQIVMNEKSPEYNWEKRVNDMVALIKDKYKGYPTPNLLFTMGSDFASEAAERTFNQIDKLIAGFRKFNPKIDGKEVNVIYSTPNCYTKAVNDYVLETGTTLQVKTDDFMPYADSPNQVWSGFFTSRPTSKRYERVGNNLLQVTRQLTTLAGLPYGTNKLLERSMGVMQHHDAITGTEKEAVEKDYHRLLTIGIEQALKDAGKSLSLLNGVDDLEITSCSLANVSICDASDKDNFNALLYNPLARTVSRYVQIPVNGDAWTVTNPDDEEVEVAITKLSRSHDYIASETGAKLLENILIFKAENIPALGYSVYNVKKGGASKRQEPKMLTLGADAKVGFDDKYVTIDGTTGRIKTMTINGKTLDVDQQIMYYKSASNSGAYTFRTDENERDARSFDRCDNTVLTDSGNVVREIKQVFSDWAEQIVRIYKDEDFIEFDWTVGPIDIGDDQGKEVILRYSTSLKSNSEFYTDSNGREIIYRRRDWRPTYTYTTEEPQANNYYPVNARISLNDSDTEFAVLLDRSEGGASLSDGSIELMVHRALKNDDGKGVNENLNEQEYGQGVVARGSHYVTFGDKIKGNGEKSMAALERDLAHRILLAPWLFLTSKDVPKKTLSLLTKELPVNAHLLTIDRWVSDENKYLVRLEHPLEKNEDDKLSVDVTVDLAGLFDGLTITSLDEYLLAANTPLSEASRLAWPQLASQGDVETRLQRAADDTKITLSPMQIRTFVATTKSNK